MKILVNNKDPAIAIEMYLQEGLEDPEDFFYMVFPAINGKGIPSSPSTHSKSSNSSLKIAKQDALEEVAKIKKLSLDQIRVFDWKMIENIE